MQETDRAIIHDWIEILLRQTVEQGKPPGPRALMDCAESHYRLSGIEEKLQPLIGDLTALIGFLSTDMGWRITHDPQRRTIVADENKPDCVCPLHRAGLVDHGALCDCSRGFAERMFSRVAGHPVEAEVAQSILRGAKTCVYRIRY